MKIAVTCDPDGSLSTHFGRSAFFQLFEVEDGKIVREEPRLNRPECGNSAPGHHGPVDALPRDCKAVLCGGMGNGAAQHFIAQNIEPIVVLNTTLSPRQAVEAFLAHKLERGAIHSCCHSHEGH